MIMIFSQLLLFFVICILLTRFVWEVASRKLNTLPSNGFSEIDESLVDGKFVSFDSELGWERQANQQKINELNNKKYRRTTDEYGSRICPVGRSETGIKIATFGDSFCECRQVDDTETFQYYLSKSLDCHVSNYGVGNYGLDQALLRMKRRLEQDQADYVVLAVTSTTIARIVSVWKHYYEFGNVLAVKPRFVLQDNKLTQIPTPIESRSALVDLHEYEEHLQKHDYHYENWYRKYQWPFVLRYAVDPSMVTYVGASFLRKIEQDTNYTLPFGNFEDVYHESKINLKQNHHKEYECKLYHKFDDLYMALIQEFVEYTRKQGAVPIFLPLEQYSDILFEQRTGKTVDGHIKQKIRSECPDLIICDPRKTIAAMDGFPEEAYVYGKAHYSPRANEIIADELKNCITNHMTSNK